MRRLVPTLATLLLLPAGWCEEGSDPEVPDFRLADLNPLSPRHQQEVSPRDYRLQVTGYYFGSSG